MPDEFLNVSGGWALKKTILFVVIIALAVGAVLFLYPERVLLFGAVCALIVVVVQHFRRKKGPH